MRAFLSWTALCGLVLSGCGTGAEPLASGGGIEIPNGLRVRVVDDSGNPVQGASVRRLAGSAWAQRLGEGLPVLLDSARTDASGHALLKGAGSDAWVEVEVGGKGARVRSADTGDVRATVEPLQVLQGVWPDSLALPLRIRVPGSSRSCVPAADRSFRLDSLSQGRYSLVAQLPSGLHAAGSATLGKLGQEGLDISLDTSGMLIEDFSDGDILFKHADLFGKGYWWRAADNPLGGMQAVFGPTDLIRSVVQQEGGSHLSMRVSMAAMSSKAPWASFGLELGGGYASPKLEAIRAVRMKVRGKGVWSLALNAKGPAGYELWRMDSLALDTAWTTVRVPRESLRQVEGLVSGESPSAPRRAVTLLFQTTSDAALEVDDLVFEGLTLGDWVRPD